MIIAIHRICVSLAHSQLYTYINFFNVVCLLCVEKLLLYMFFVGKPKCLNVFCNNLPF